MEKIEVIILPSGKGAKEVNNSTNPKMGKRHIAFESMLRTFKIDFDHLPIGTHISGYVPGKKLKAELINETTVRIL